MEVWATDTHCKHQSGMEKHKLDPTTQLKRRSGNRTLLVDRKNVEAAGTGEQTTTRGGGGEKM